MSKGQSRAPSVPAATPSARSWWRGTLLLVGALALCACGGNPPEPGEGGEDQADEGGRGFSLPGLPRPGIPNVFKVRIQQGNVVTQQMVDRLAPGMTRSQVEYVLGEPVLRNTFREERWDYLFSLSLGDRVLSKQVVSVYFEDGRLAYIEGDLKPSDAEADGTDEETTAQGADAPPGPDGTGNGDRSGTTAAASPAPSGSGA